MRVLRKLAVALVVFVACVLLAEGGNRLRLRLDGKPFDGEQLRADLLARIDTVANFTPAGADEPDESGSEPGAPASGKRKQVVMHPYTGMEDVHDSGGVLAHFREGVPEDEFSVVVMGGSVAASFGSEQRGYLAELLARDPRLAGRKPVVLNYAHAAYKQPQQLTRLIWLFVQGYRPDVVVNLDGFNEVALAAENARQGIHPLYPSPPVWSAYLPNREGQLKWGFAIARVMAVRDEMRELLAWADEWGLFRSSFTAPLVTRRMVALERERHAAQEELTGGTEPADKRPDRSRRGPPFVKNSERVMAASIQCWMDASRAMHTLCRERGVRYLHVLQPTYHDPGAKPLTEQELELNPGPPAWRSAVLSGYPLLRAGGAELAGEGIEFYDASGVFRETQVSLYYDACHFRPRGSRLLAEAVAPRLLELVEEQP